MEPVSTSLRAFLYYSPVSLSARNKKHYNYRGKGTETGPGSRTNGLPLPKKIQLKFCTFLRLLHSLGTFRIQQLPRWEKQSSLPGCVGVSIILGVGVTWIKELQAASWLNYLHPLVKPEERYINVVVN